MGMTGLGQKEVNSEINVAPLADVMLVLLIIFMVITPLLQKGVDVKLPQAEYPTDHPDNESAVTVAVRLDNTVYVNMVPIAESELPTKLSEEFEGKSERILFLKADEGLQYGDVLRVMDLCRDGGADEIGLITEQKVQS
ncbi:MAG TPA: biopolymer transporter ExbD [Vicinamibacteria bacterium]|nr:biopolymer transporter ExbD [Vicinamibacteria bacterium]